MNNIKFIIAWTTFIHALFWMSIAYLYSNVFPTVGFYFIISLIVVLFNVYPIKIKKKTK